MECDNFLVKLRVEYNLKLKLNINQVTIFYEKVAYYYGSVLF